ncbi:hypothetical protein BWK59_06375 [Flavobacterium davisii]|uniref:Uncharacterized protein n=1 Tax=Flavobacterium davisii TaxID=2906077 RepID=A0A246GIY8_9FLAO|nr:hypothetical protein [Flavobacterium davisii]OWP84213.1 hypothetical protein BWK59_06375 [Flavobacterium davisii]
MKKLILLTALLGCLFLNAQSINFKGLDSIQFVNICSKLITESKLNLKKIETGKLEWKTYDKYVDNENNVFYILYFTHNQGENKDLGVKGVKKWTIDSVASKYLIVFDLYKNLFNSKADKEKIQKLGTDWDNKNGNQSLRKTSQEGLWEIKSKI